MKQRIRNGHTQQRMNECDFLQTSDMARPLQVAIHRMSGGWVVQKNCLNTTIIAIE